MAPPTSAVLLTIPSSLPKLRPAPVTTTLLKGLSTVSPSASSGYISSSSNSVVEEELLTSSMAGPQKAKKRRLDHLSWEEKVQRKKLKNRVAAQTSRDRKKARMEEMEYEIKELSDKTEILQNKCESLQAINDSLLAKNQKLDAEVELLRTELAEIKQNSHTQSNNKSSSSSNANKVNADGCASIQTGSAVSNTDPLQQGTPMDTQSSAHSLTTSKLRQQLKKSNTTASLWRIVALCLLYKTCCSSTTKNSMRDGLKNWPKACSQISQQTWKQALGNAVKLLPKLQASQSDCLDQWWGPQQSGWNPTGIELVA